MEQVLLNLAVNARDAMPTGGTLIIDTENFIVDDAYAARDPRLKAGTYVRLRVVDTGTGMDRDVIERAFEPFFSTKPKEKGSGLGLATVYGIVNQAGGMVDLESDLGTGTTITILLPSVAAATAQPDAPPKRDAQKPRWRDDPRGGGRGPGARCREPHPHEARLPRARCARWSGGARRWSAIIAASSICCSPTS